MSPLFGIDLGVWIGIAIALIGSIAAFFYWKGGLDQWKKSVDDWRNSVDNRFDKLVENINTLMSDVAVIKSDSEKNATRNGMIQRHSPLVPSKKAIEILEELNILSQVDANISYIQEEIEKRSQTSIYRDIEDPEERFIEIAPGVIHGLIKKGKIEEKKIDEAMKKLEKVFPVVTYYGVLLLIAAYILEKGKEKGFTTKPSMIYSQIDMAGSKDVDILLASFDGNVEKTIKSLEMSIRTLGEVDNKKELAENMNKLAVMYEYVGRVDEAEKEYREVIRINPDFAKARSNLGNLLADLKKYKESEKEYREAIRINPDFVEAHYNLGILLKGLERSEEAVREYRDAIRIDPDYAGAHNNLGNLLADLGGYEEAEEEYREAIRINPKLPEAHNNLGILLYNLKRYDEAEEEYREAIRINPNDTAAHNNLGVLLKDLERYEESEREYREAIRINPDYAEAHANLSILLSKIGKKEEAKDELEVSKDCVMHKKERGM
jgi:tetratricopeptide (TPR) repeat protein